MSLTHGDRYTIVYREGGEEKTALAHYRGFGTADSIARDNVLESSQSENEGLHWFEIDGTTGYLTLEADDLVSFEPAPGYESI